MYKSPHRKHRSKLQVTGKWDKSSPPIFRYDYITPSRGKSISALAGGLSPGKLFKSKPAGKGIKTMKVPDKSKKKVARKSR